jgi:hypothetical protein
MKIWENLTDEGKEAVLIGAFLAEFFLLFVVAA